MPAGAAGTLLCAVLPRGWSTRGLRPPGRYTRGWDPASRRVPACLAGGAGRRVAGTAEDARAGWERRAPTCPSCPLQPTPGSPRWGSAPSPHPHTTRAKPAEGPVWRWGGVCDGGCSGWWDLAWGYPALELCRAEVWRSRRCASCVGATGAQLASLLTMLPPRSQGLSSRGLSGPTLPLQELSEMEMRVGDLGGGVRPGWDPHLCPVGGLGSPEPRVTWKPAEVTGAPGAVEPGGVTGAWEPLEPGDQSPAPSSE